MFLKLLYSYVSDYVTYFINQLNAFNLKRSHAIDDHNVESLSGSRLQDAT